MGDIQIAKRVASWYLREVVTARQKTALRVHQLRKLMGMGSHFGVLSAYTTTSKSENKRRHTNLIRDLQAMGYRRWEPLRGKWEGVSERSILVPGMSSQDLFELGRRYQQDAVIYKSREGVVGMYFTEGVPRAVLAVDPSGSPALQISPDPGSELYSKARGLRFEFGFVWTEVPWDGRTPISRADVERMALS